MSHASESQSDQQGNTIVAGENAGQPTYIGSTGTDGGHVLLGHSLPTLLRRLSPLSTNAEPGKLLTRAPYQGSELLLNDEPLASIAPSLPSSPSCTSTKWTLTSRLSAKRKLLDRLEDSLVLLQQLDHPTHLTPAAESDDFDDEETLRRLRRKKIDKTRIAWETNIDATELRESVKVLISQLENFSRDPKEAVRLVKFSGNAPIFPDDSWKDILCGSFVDFNTVHKELFGAREVTTETEWLRVWGAVKKAMAFAFSNRGTELDAYSTYISNFFHMLKPEYHSNVLNFDIAVRKLVANTRNILLSDSVHFTGLERSYLTPGGIHNVDPSRKPRVQRGNLSRSVCRNWNYGRCARGNKPCPAGRKHICATCGGDHRKKDVKVCNSPQ